MRCFGVLLLLFISISGFAADEPKDGDKPCPRKFRWSLGQFLRGRDKVVLDTAGLPVQGERVEHSSGHNFGENRTFEIPFDPVKDHVVVQIGTEGERAEQTMATMVEVGGFNSQFLFPAGNLAQSYIIGRPKPTGGGAAVVKAKDLPADLFEQRQQAPAAPKPKAADPLGLNSISRGQVTFRRSPDGASIVITNGYYDPQGRFVQATNNIRVASELPKWPKTWNDIPPLRGLNDVKPEKPGDAPKMLGPEEVSIELTPRSQPYYLELPNGAVFVLNIKPKAGAVPKPLEAPLTEVNPKAFQEKLAGALGGEPKTGEVVTLKSKPRLPDHPNGNHYVGAYEGVVVVDGQAYVVLRATNKKSYLYPADRIDFAQATKGVDPKLIGPGPGNLLAKPKTGPVNPKVEPFNPQGDVDAQLAAYLGSFTHPLKGKEAWHDYAAAQRGVSRGGNVEGAKEIRMPDGSSAIAKTYVEAVSTPGDIETVVRGLKRMEEYAAQGRGPRVFGVGYKVVGSGNKRTVQITVIMENMTPHKKEGANGAELTVAGGDAAWISKEARELPEGAKIWLRDSLLFASSPTNHPDGHFLNVGYRITHIRSDADLPKHGNYYRVGDRIVEVYAVDSVGKLAEQTIGAMGMESLRGVMKQYDPAHKRRVLNEDLGLKD